MYTTHMFTIRNQWTKRELEVVYKKETCHINFISLAPSIIPGHDTHSVNDCWISFTAESNHVQIEKQTVFLFTRNLTKISYRGQWSLAALFHSLYYGVLSVEH